MSEDEWIADGLRITDDETLLRMRQILENESPLIIEHRFYRGSRSPHRFICEAFDDLETYLRDRARHGDSFWLWRFEQVCQDQNAVIAGAKMPDLQGRVPKSGAY
jgi:hypothetical protein